LKTLSIEGGPLTWIPKKKEGFAIRKKRTKKKRRWLQKLGRGG